MKFIYTSYRLLRHYSLFRVGLITVERTIVWKPNVFENFRFLHWPPQSSLVLQMPGSLLTVIYFVSMTVGPLIRPSSDGDSTGRRMSTLLQFFFSTYLLFFSSSSFSHVVHSKLVQRRNRNFQRGSSNIISNCKLVNVIWYTSST